MEEVNQIEMCACGKMRFSGRSCSRCGGNQSPKMPDRPKHISHETVDKLKGRVIMVDKDKVRFAA